jgi:ribosomal protein L2
VGTEVFEFSSASGVLKGTSMPLRKVPEGLLVPPVPKDEEEQKYLPDKIYIKFTPK